MPYKLIAMLIVRRLSIFLVRGLPIRTIAAELQIGIKTVVTYTKIVRQRNKILEELLEIDDITLGV